MISKSSFLFVIFITSYFVANLYAVSISLGGLALTSQLTSQKKRRSITTDSYKQTLPSEEEYEKWNKEYEEFTVNISGVIDKDASDTIRSATLLQLLQRIVKGSDIFNDKSEDGKMVIDMQNSVIEFPATLFGRNVYITKSTKNDIEIESTNDDDLVSVLEYWSINPKKNKKSLRLKTQITLSGNKLKINIYISSKGISKNTIKKIKNINRNFWKSRLEREMQVAIVRNKNFKTYSIISKEVLKLKKEKRLDKEAYPEKYKKQSPSVRKTGSGAVSFSSSSATSSGNSE